MTNIPYQLLRFSLIAFFAVPCLISCKENDLDAFADQEVPATSSRTEQTLDSIFLYAQQMYLWNDFLPSYAEFNPRQYRTGSDELVDFGNELVGIAAYAVNPETDQPYEYRADNSAYTKYSYIEESEDASGDGFVSALSSTETGYGFELGVLDDSIYAIYVKPGSPADDAGLQRSDRVISLNGRNLYSLASLDAINRVYSDALAGSSLTMETKKADGTEEDLYLNRSTFDTNPVYAHKVLESGGSKVGYLAYGQFGDTDDANSYFADIFDEFASEGVQELVIDLRYNGGGYVSTAEVLCDYILPSSNNGSVLYKQEFNQLMQDGNASILQNQPYLDQNGEQQYSDNGKALTYADVTFSLDRNTTNVQKKGSLDNVQRVAFIVSGKTASASELVINSLKPYLDVTIIGETSYGKPVGFFPIKIDQYDVYLSSFRTINANDEGDYYAGLEPDIEAYDDYAHDFGDTDEYALNQALQAMQINVRMVPQPVKMPKAINFSGDKTFNGMIDNSPKQLK